MFGSAFKALALATSMIAVGAAQAAPGHAVQREARAPFFPSDAVLTEMLRALVEQGEAKGIVLGLLEPDGTRRIISYGDAGAGARPLGPKSVYEIGSINKTFTGAILADMVAKGEVALDDPVAKYLPSGVKVPTRGGKQITLLDLATHSSGLPRVPSGYKIPDRSNPYAHYQADDLYAFLSSHELERDIGVDPLYSNLGMGLLGHALTRAAGAESFPALVRERITGPLGMRMTDYGRAGEIGAAMVKGHGKDGSTVPYWDVAVLSGAGGLNANAEDMLTYLAANIGAPTSPIEQAMRTAQQPRMKVNDKGLSVGLGWQTRVRDGRNILNHGGGTGGFETYLGFDPATGAGVVVLGNSDGFDDRDALTYQLLRGGGAAARVADPADYVGSYRLSPELEVAVTAEGGALYAQASGQPRMRLFGAGKDRFFPMLVEAELAFARGADGAVSGVTLVQGGESATGARAGIGAR